MELDSGATAWVLASAALVLLMTPALALFYGGMTRSKSVLNMMMMSFGAMAVVGVIYVLWGYSMSFGPDVLGDGSAGLFGDPLAYFGLHGLMPSDADPLGVANTLFPETASGGHIPALAGVAFQLTFAVIAVALVSGAVADRVKYSTWLVFAGIWATVAYFPLAHMVWGGGLLSSAGPFGSMFDGVAPIDFAGGTVVHVNAGVAGLVLALVVGRRTGFRKDPMKPHHLPFVMLGAGLLWFGWFGFNAGSAGDANSTAALAWVNTCAAAAAAIGGWLAVERVRDGHATSLGAASGVVAGLVAITPAAAALSPAGSLALGAVAGAACAAAVSLKFRFGFDDSLDVVGVHLVGGLVGTIGIGFLATDHGLLYGGGMAQLVVQLLVVAVAVGYSAATTIVIALVLRWTLGWRVSAEAEAAGIDIAEHRESAYDLEPGSGSGLAALGPSPHKTANLARANASREALS